MCMGIASSSVCCYLGFPCVEDDAFLSLLFRTTCVGYFTCSLLPYLLGPCKVSQAVLRTGMLVHSASAFLVSAYWCVGFGEWALLIVMVDLFQVFGVMVLLGDHVHRHFVFTFLGTIVAYMCRSERDAAAFHGLDMRAWAAMTVTVVVLLVGGVWFSGHHSIQFLQKKWDAVTSILAMSQEECLGL
ncbi:Protein kinase domain-containing protein [Durusdinium trenchii]|uniref:Protein kinase domain-containing protein n=1 Tax=Durusdinium trenchii TaxID=1381693 RepID=A0ABP0HUY2_9DINO